MCRDPQLPALHTQPLTGSDLHIWTAALSGAPEQLAYFDSLLSADEKARAERFYFERDRDRYIFGRGILRTLLASYLGMDASEILFAYGPYRKPQLVLPTGRQTLHFNVAHSNDWAAYVFGWDRPVGIDLERVHPLANVDGLVKRFFSPRESSLIHSLADDAKWDMFYKIWTCKEAILKAHGSGLTIPLNYFEISLGANDAVTVTSQADEAAPFAAWHLEILALVSGYTSAVAVPGNVKRIQLQSFAW